MEFTYKILKMCSSIVAHLVVVRISQNVYEFPRRIELNTFHDVSFLHHVGDDCVSIQTGCSNILVHNVNCGPGHGISIGSLGKENTKACVSNVTVRDITLQNTLTGVRIKTWQVKL